MVYLVTAEVIKMKGECPVHRVGDKVEFYENVMKGKMCLSAFRAMWLSIVSLMYDSKVAWLKGQDSTVQQCPDPAADVIFLVKRGRELSDEELAQAYGITVDEYRRLMGRDIMQTLRQRDEI